MNEQISQKEMTKAKAGLCKNKDCFTPHEFHTVYCKRCSDNHKKNKKK